ncbi:MAG TPA: transcription antitermination factor NusB [Bacteroidales bacterium]
MLYRRHLRIKVLQALYAYYSDSSADLSSGERQLLQSINKLYELFIYQLSFLLEVKRFAEQRVEDNKLKYYPTKDDLDPNLKFVRNKVFELIENNKDFQRKEAAFKVNWGQENELVRRFYNTLRESDIYSEYMNSKTRSLDEDKKFMLKITDKLLSENELLKSFYEEKSVYFVDGYDLDILLLIKFFEVINKKFTSEKLLPGIYKTEGDAKNEDEDFVKKLYRKTILKEEENTKILEGKTSNWDYDRIPLMDIIILKMAIIELQEMETVPVKVTLNEYIELAKYFSTANSRTFVNGVLDRLIHEFKEQGKINKLGRGLVE